MMDRSSKSDRVTMSEMPFRITGRLDSKIFSSESEYSSRVLKPLPVDNRHRASDSHSGICDMLSNAKTQPLLAAIAKSRSSRGAPRVAALDGSTSDFDFWAMLDFALPCSPVNTRTGNGRFGRRSETRKALTSAKSLSLATLMKGFKSSRQPPLFGSGVRSIPRGRTNLTGAFLMICHFFLVILTTRHLGSARSRYRLGAGYLLRFARTQPGPLLL